MAASTPDNNVGNTAELFTEKSSERPEDADRLGRQVTFRQLAWQWQQLAEDHEGEVARLHAQNEALKAAVNHEERKEKELEFLSRLSRELGRGGVQGVADMVAQRMRQIRSSLSDTRTSLISNGDPALNGKHAGPDDPDNLTTNEDIDFVFALNDADTIKNKVRESLLKSDVYNVADCYYDTGVVQRIARSTQFEYTTLGVIAANAVWMGYDTDFNDSAALMKADIQFIVVENFFCLYFSGELLIRFLAFRKKASSLRDAWFVFDSVLVFLMVMETWIFVIFFGGQNPFGDNTAILRLFRLLRLTRLVKMLNSFPQLLILVKGMVTALKSVGYVIVLLVGITYVFAIACTQLSVDYEVIKEKYFHGVALSMYSLVVYATFLDNLSEFMDDIRAESTAVLIVASIFIFLSALTVMNMLIGILCEVIAAVAQTEKEQLLTQQVKSEMKAVLDELDSDGNGMVSYEELKGILSHEAGVKALKNVDVDPLGLIDFAEMFFFDEKKQPIEITFEHFMELVLDLRATNTATLKDLMNVSKQFSVKQNALHLSVEALHDRLGIDIQK